MRAICRAGALAAMIVIPNGPLFAQQMWMPVWSDEFDRTANSPVDSRNWLCDSGTQYPGGPPQWGTGEVETMTCSVANVYHDGAGHLVIKPLHTGSSPTEGWTSGRIETQRVFDAPPNGGALAIEASLQQPDVSGAAAAGIWPAFWALGAAYRGNYQNWPGIGEIDIMEDVNGQSSTFATLHCGTAPGGPCHEYAGISSGQRPCPGCQTGLHTYRIELDRSVSPQEIRWYLDGAALFTVRATEVDAATWNSATNHPFFVILDVAIGGGFPGNPTASTSPGVPMIVDYVRVFKRAAPFTDDPLVAGVTEVRATHVAELRSRIDALRTRFGLPAYMWNDPTLTPTATVVDAIHIADLRAALTQVYTAAGLTPPMYTDQMIEGVTIRAVHIAELRAAVAAVE